MIGCLASLSGQGVCGNGSLSVGHDGDNCTISCHPGCVYEGNITSEICENTGSGSETSIVCVPLNCTNLNVQLGYDNATVTPSSCGLQYQSQCTVSCDEGFTGDDVTYLCNVTSDPTMVDWVPIGGVDVMCETGLFNTYHLRCMHVRMLHLFIAQCPVLMNGNLTCPNGATIGVFKDTCTFSCDAGYELQGSINGTCLANQSWSGGDPICVTLKCSTSPPLNNSQLQSSCDTQYQSTCTTVCVDGYTGVGGSYTCVVTDEDTNSVGWNGSTSCQKGN